MRTIRGALPFLCFSPWCSLSRRLARPGPIMSPIQDAPIQSRIGRIVSSRAISAAMAGFITFPAKAVGIREHVSTSRGNAGFVLRRRLERLDGGLLTIDFLRPSRLPAQRKRLVLSNQPLTFQRLGRWGLTYIMPPMPPMPPMSGIPAGGPPASLAGASATMASVVINKEAMEAASCRA